MELARGLVQSWQHSMAQPGSLTQDRVASCAVGVIVFCQRATLSPPLLSKDTGIWTEKMEGHWSWVLVERSGSRQQPRAVCCSEEIRIIDLTCLALSCLEFDLSRLFSPFF